MSKSIVITLIGDDRPGIVESISNIIVRHQGEWVESRMANLSGKFSGILSLNLPQTSVDGFLAELKSNPIQGISINAEEVKATVEPLVGQCFKLELVGQDRPGIIHRISSALANNGATVEELESEVIDASMSGEKLFKASITVCLEAGHDIDELGEVLEELANELIVDIEMG